MTNNNSDKLNENINLGKEIIKEYFKEIDRREEERAKREQEKEKRKSTFQIIFYSLMGAFVFILYLIFNNVFVD